MIYAVFVIRLSVAEIQNYQLFTPKFVVKSSIPIRANIDASGEDVTKTPALISLPVRHPYQERLPKHNFHTCVKQVCTTNKCWWFCVAPRPTSRVLICKFNLVFAHTQTKGKRAFFVFRRVTIAFVFLRIFVWVTCLEHKRVLAFNLWVGA